MRIIMYNRCPICSETLRNGVCMSCGYRVQNKTSKTLESCNVHISTKYRLVALLLAMCLGFFGVHRFYVGKIGTGLIYLLTFGLFGIGLTVDIFLIICGIFRDKQGGLVVNWTANSRVTE